jgi:hypothetical protein
LEGSQYPNHYPCQVVKQVHNKWLVCELPACWLGCTTKKPSLLETRTLVYTLTLPRSKGHQWWFALDCTPHTPFSLCFCLFPCVKLPTIKWPVCHYKSGSYRIVVEIVAVEYYYLPTTTCDEVPFFFPPLRSTQDHAQCEYTHNLEGSSNTPPTCSLSISNPLIDLT